MTSETVRTTGSLTIARLFRTTPERLYDCWTDRAHLAAWSGPRGFTSSTEVFDPTPGGRHQSTMYAPDGTAMRSAGEYKVTDRGHRLVFTHAWLGADDQPGPETTVLVTFARQAGGTLMVFHQAGFDDEGARDGHAKGWAASFDRLASLLVGFALTEDMVG